MSIQEEVFGGNTTLWEVLNAQNVPNLTEDLGRLETQLNTLGVTLQNYQADTNAQLVTISTRLNGVDIQIETINNNITNINASINLLGNRVTGLENNILTINSSITSINNELSSIRGSLNSQNTRIIVLENSVTSINSRLNTVDARVQVLESNAAQNNWIKYNTLYSVIEWFNWSPSYTTYEMTIIGTGSYVPLNRTVQTRIGSSLSTAVFGPAIREIPGVNGAAPAPLMEGLAGVRHSDVTGYRLIYINKTV